jgi:hypothetical protein
MIQKAQEFHTMTQGTMRVEEYECHFTKMMRYAADGTNTEEKKQFWFLRGLHHGICQIVTGCEYPSLRSLVNRAIAVERESAGRTASVTRRGRPSTTLMTGTPGGHGMHHPIHPGTVSVLTSATIIGTSAAEMASTRVTEPLEDKHREEEAPTASSQRQKP